MKILYVVSAFPTLSESFVINEINELTNRGHTVVVFARKATDESFSHTEVQNMDITVHTAGKPTLRSLFEIFDGDMLNQTMLSDLLTLKSPIYIGGNIYVCKKLEKVIKSEPDIDLIHAHFASPTRLGVSYMANKHDIPFMVTAHAHEIFANPNGKAVRRICQRSNHVICPSKYNKEYLTETFGITTEMSVVPATTNVKKFYKTNGEKEGRILTVGRLVEKKGHKFAIGAVSRLIDDGYDITYRIVGTGEEEEYLRKEVKRHGIEEHVSFLGHVSDDQLQKEYNEASIFVLPCIIAKSGDRDAMPVVLKEAMATKTACVSTRISAIPELITDGYNGRIVEPKNEKELSVVLGELLDDPDKRQKLGQNGYSVTHERFDISNSVDKIEDIIHSMVK